MLSVLPLSGVGAAGFAFIVIKFVFVSVSDCAIVSGVPEDTNATVKLATLP